MNLARVILLLLGTLLYNGAGSAQTTLQCTNKQFKALKKAIEQHNDHAYRLNRKFKDVWYPQGPIPPAIRKAIQLDTIVTYLGNLKGRKSAVLLHGVKQDRLYSWLITHQNRIICSPPKHLSKQHWQRLQAYTWSRLGVRGAKKPRTAEPLDEIDLESSTPNDWQTILKELAEILLPPSIQQELKQKNIDTLVVVPITVRKFNPSIDLETDSATNMSGKRSTFKHPTNRAALSIGVVPFAALPFDGGALIDKMSVVIAPGFLSFAQKPATPRTMLRHPIIIGNPVHKEFQDLPGAQAEAKKTAKLIDAAHLLIGNQATREAVKSHLVKYADDIDYIHLATHGVADVENPVDQSYLVFSDGTWNARDISRLRRKARAGEQVQDPSGDLPLLSARPVVVMSACQTALGKDFPAGTIGLARAWHWAGASNVVMSLWSVDDEATQYLMQEFVDLIKFGVAADKALQAASRKLRINYPNPSYWASFSVYGAPLLLGTSTKPSP